MRLQNAVTLLSAGSMAGDLTSSVQDLQQMYGAAIQAVWTGASAAGTLKLQASVDNTTFTDVTGSSTTVAGAGDYMWNIIGGMYRYVRVVFTRSSGTGSLTIKLDGKG